MRERIPPRTAPGRADSEAPAAAPGDAFPQPGRPLRAPVGSGCPNPRDRLLELVVSMHL